MNGPIVTSCIEITALHTFNTLTNFLVTTFQICLCLTCEIYPSESTNGRCKSTFSNPYHSLNSIEFYDLSANHDESLQSSTMFLNRDAELGLVLDFAEDGGLGVCVKLNPSTSLFCDNFAAGMLPTLTRLALRGAGLLPVRIVICVGVINSISARVGDSLNPP